jgi:hypothetical protein
MLTPGLLLHITSALRHASRKIREAFTLGPPLDSLLVNTEHECRQRLAEILAHPRYTPQQKRWACSLLMARETALRNLREYRAAHATEYSADPTRAARAQREHETRQLSRYFTEHGCLPRPNGPHFGNIS